MPKIPMDDPLILNKTALHNRTKAMIYLYLNNNSLIFLEELITKTTDNKAMNNIKINKIFSYLVIQCIILIDASGAPIFFTVVNNNQIEIREVNKPAIPIFLNILFKITSLKI